MALHAQRLQVLVTVATTEVQWHDVVDLIRRSDDTIASALRA